MDRDALEATLAQRTSALRALEDSNQQLQALAAADPLTGLSNRRHFVDRAERAIQRASAEGRSTAVLLIDVDHFKVVNDTYGHAAGDVVLRSLAGWLTASVRPQDIVARIGGEEFAV